ncbi:MAG: hypothetical protein JNK23_10470 [Opitutaceae bacterium]|nr:hypothetical protein [Opitutaceae bacterium]
MNDQKLATLVAEAVELDRNITEGQERLKEIKAQLAQEAESRAEDATPTEGGGTSIEFAGRDGCIARVTTAGATLKSTIKGEGRDIEKVRAAADRHFGKLFLPVLAYKPAENFREEAAALLGAKDAAKLVKLCTNPGKVTVSFETKEAAA